MMLWIVILLILVAAGLEIGLVIETVKIETVKPTKKREGKN